MQGIPDHLDHNLKILFVGYNPGERSAETRHHYAGRNNQFWRLLYDSGLTARLVPSDEDYLLPKEEGYGLTNIVARPSKSSSDLKRTEMQEGADILKRKIMEFQPRIVCLLGKDVYRNYAGLKATAPVQYGPVVQNVLHADIKEYVGPNPSGRNVITYAAKLSYFKELKNLLETTLR